MRWHFFWEAREDEPWSGNLLVSFRLDAQGLLLGAMAYDEQLRTGKTGSAEH